MISVRSTGVGVLDKAMAIVELCEYRPSSASQIARELDMKTSTAHRLATALVAHELLQRDESGVYRLGRRAQPSRLTDLARPCLERLTRDIRETSQLWLARGSDRICVASVIADTELRVVLASGVSLPLSEGGSAAYALQGQLGEEGWCEAVSRRTPGLGSVSAPVKEGDDIIAAVCVVAPLFRMPGSPGDAYGAQVVATAARISRLLAA
ncbi:MAG TPA: helix-turn-helix domain-containing protein [Streptomyces sp.]|uniref:IclR family transcriptional regulator n=1 Tax=Streptomyces sp. TaxID=1931 RepID=UPI002D0041C5|nr:helix-turn-helix domain-containing protein [Streptomyces sp.]HWU08076.1 helix-turn-helix domain-containing protein [Streptomyces sp.]